MPIYAFLGPAGTFSEEALLSLDVDGLEPLACSSIDEVFEAVERGRADAGVVPIENSVEGSVPATLDALAFDTSLEIQAESVLDIHHALITAPGVGHGGCAHRGLAPAGHRSVPALASSQPAGSSDHRRELDRRGGADGSG